MKRDGTVVEIASELTEKTIIIIAAVFRSKEI